MVLVTMASITQRQCHMPRAAHSEQYMAPWHGRPNPNSTIEDGADFRQLGTYFLAILHHWGLLDRIDSFRDSGRVPLAACNVTKFHREYWTDFQKICGKPFDKLAEAQQTIAFKQFLFQMEAIPFRSGSRSRSRSR